jgi:hypothetical protein
MPPKSTSQPIRLLTVFWMSFVGSPVITVTAPTLDACTRYSPRSGRSTVLFSPAVRSSSMPTAGSPRAVSVPSEVITLPSAPDGVTYTVTVPASCPCGASGGGPL